MNDLFDVCNGRFIKDGINIQNWGKKKSVLDAMLRVLDETEKCHRQHHKYPELPKEMFVSQTTLEAWRITIHSIIALTEELLNAGYITVLTGKFNQDPLEVTMFTLICYFLNNIKNSFPLAIFRNCSFF